MNDSTGMVGISPRFVALFSILILALAGSLIIHARQRSIVVTTCDVPAFTTLTEVHLQVKGAWPNADTTLKKALIGRTTAQAMKKGALISETALLSEEEGLHLDEAVLLHVPITTTQALVPGISAVLYGVQAEADSAIIVSDTVRIMAVLSSEVVIMVTEEEARAAAPYLLEKRRLLVLPRVSALR